MELLYVEEHVNCCNYSKPGKRLQDNGQAIINHNFVSGDIVEHLLTDTEMLFILDGALKLSANGVTSIRLVKGDAILLPMGNKYIAQMEKETQMMVCKLPPGIDLCETYSMSKLYDEKNKIKSRGEYSVLHMNERIWTFATNVIDCINDGLKCVKFLRMKITELMFLFRVYYTKEELANFFYPILNKDMEFANVILANWASVKNKAELASLTNLSPSRFGVKFKEVFGISPYQWLINQRSERIYYELVYTNRTLKQISEDFKFGSVQHFNDFCKKQFGETPGYIRDNKGRKLLLQD